MAALGAVVLLAACTATPKPSPVAEVANKVTAPKPDCLQTGTRIPLKEGECGASAGRVYTKDELDRTGETNTAEALRQLDPSFGR